MTFWPTATVPVEAVFAIERSAEGLTGDGSIEVSLAGLVSTGLETRASLMIGGVAAGSTFTLIVIGGNDAPGARLLARVQVTVCATTLQVQPAPEAEVGVRSAGSVSVTVVVVGVARPPWSEALPTLPTARL